MNMVIAGLAASVGGSDGAPRPGHGADKVHLLVVMTSERGLCGGFNTIVRLIRAKAAELLVSRQDRQDPDGRQEGPGTAAP